MNHDHVALAGVVGSAALLFATAHLLFFVPLFGSAVYGGWRAGKHLIPADAEV